MVKALVALVAAMFMLAEYLTWRTGSGPRARIFARGRAPNPVPNGFYRGSAGYTGSWKGKTFNPAASRGINVFGANGKDNSEQYPFKTYGGKGLQDSSLDVLKIDYDLPENPLWIRSILDEIVEVQPGEYLGKIHLRLVPGMPFTVGYFELKQ